MSNSSYVYSPIAVVGAISGSSSMGMGCPSALAIDSSTFFFFFFFGLVYSKSFPPSYCISLSAYSTLAYNSFLSIGLPLIYALTSSKSIIT